MSRHSDPDPGQKAPPEADKQSSPSKNQSDDPRQPIHIRRGAQVELRLSLRKHRGHEFVDVRQFFATDDGEWLPSRRGVTLKPEQWDELMRAVVELDRRLRASGVVENGEACHADTG